MFSNVTSLETNDIIMAQHTNNCCTHLFLCELAWVL